MTTRPGELRASTRTMILSARPMRLQCSHLHGYRMFALRLAAEFGASARHAHIYISSYRDDEINSVVGALV
jgi:hypothetical protein